jgi:hypothetical protein
MGDQPIAMLRDRLENLRMARMVTEGLANFRNRLRDRVVAHDGPGPNLGLEFVSGHDLARPTREANQQLHGFGFEAMGPASPLDGIAGAVNAPASDQKHSIEQTGADILGYGKPLIFQRQKKISGSSAFLHKFLRREIYYPS